MGIKLLNPEEPAMKLRQVEVLWIQGLARDFVRQVLFACRRWYFFWFRAVKPLRLWVKAALENNSGFGFGAPSRCLNSFRYFGGRWFSWVGRRKVATLRLWWLSH